MIRFIDKPKSLVPKPARLVYDINFSGLGLFNFQNRSGAGEILLYDSYILFRFSTGCDHWNAKVDIIKQQQEYCQMPEVTLPVRCLLAHSWRPRVEVSFIWAQGSFDLNFCKIIFYPNFWKSLFLFNLIKNHVNTLRMSLIYLSKQINTLIPALFLTSGGEIS